MTRFIKQTLATLALAALILPGQAAAQNQETVKATYGDWEVRCAENNDKNCIIAQVGNTTEGKKVLEIRIRKLEGAKTKDGQVVPAAIIITTPLASILRAGVRIQIDGGAPHAGPFEVCVPAGCVVQEPMSEEFLNQLKSGSAATVSYTLLQRGEIKATISLKGFTKAFGAL